MLSIFDCLLKGYTKKPRGSVVTLRTLLFVSQRSAAAVLGCGSKF